MNSMTHEHDTASASVSHGTSRTSLEVEERSLPTYCPSWCTTDHAQDLADGASMWEACVHRGELGDVTLAELRNGIDHRVWRQGLGRYDVILEQDPHPDSDLRGAVNGDPLVRLRLEDGIGVGSRFAELRLTTGEARVLAAKLLAAAERVDIES